MGQTQRQGEDWDPDKYGRFQGVRLRPALDLIARVGDLPSGKIIDLGCGAGAAAEALDARWPDRKIVGVDASKAMVKRAAQHRIYHRVDLCDIREWEPGKAPALIFSNAVLQWLGHHPALLTRFARMLKPGGVLAVQMPVQFGAPSHRLMREIAAAMFPDRFDFKGWVPPVATPEIYARLLAPLGQADVWTTQYMQRLPRGDGAHPVLRFTESTALRPFVERLSEPERRAFVVRYQAALDAAYPIESDGTVLFPFRRLFFVLKVQ